MNTNPTLNTQSSILVTNLNPYDLGDGLVFSSSQTGKLDQSTVSFPGNPDPGGYSTNPDPGGYSTNPDSNAYPTQDPLFAKDLRKKVNYLNLFITLHFISVL